MAVSGNGKTGGTSMTDGVVDQLTAHFAAQHLGEGDSIPSTGKLAEEFGVSRTVIREALAQLTARGMLDRRQGRECVIAQPGAEQLSTLLRTKFTFEYVSAHDLHAFREVVEVGAVRLAARNPLPQTVALLSDLANELRTETDDEARLRIDMEFHQAIATAANPVFGFVLGGLSALLMESRLAVWERYVAEGGEVDVAVDRHVALRDAIAAADPDAAEAAMRADLADTESGLNNLNYNLAQN